ncbi:MAG TPA: FAD-dependent oxidoreductase [Kineosporiaceae bacterium]|nr:FAD-dependent oxidoreductase [Kineosporiaceae bacterium]
MSGEGVRPQVAERQRVVVIGGGIAGLCAADRADRGADVTLLEAGPRVGGKLAHRTGGRGSSSKPALTRCWSSSRRRAHSWMPWVCGGGWPARAAIAGETTFCAGANSCRCPTAWRA